MTYQGVKFKTKMLGSEIPQDLRLEGLKDWCKKFHHYNLAPPYEGGSYGNLSFRLQDGQDQFIITGTKIGLKNELADDCFVRIQSCDLEKGTVYAHGMREPSSESMLHFAIYHQRKDVNAIFHGHCQKILSKASKLKITETVKEEPYGTVELVQGVLDILNDKSFLIMKEHGFISLGKNIKEAGELALQMYKKC
ncbi:class II aldolase/adducin family protein [Patescibacteria group bacterium]|nr:class II aldolase/adducin family protein [Patescibacteria group bacterium]